VSNRYWGRIYSDYPEFQFALVDGGDVVAAFERGGEPDRVCALAIVVAPAARGRGVSRTMLEHMRKLAAPIGPLVAPVRPTLKEQHPYVSIADYVTWRRDDGTHVDPWVRTHERLGGELLGPAEEAMLIEASEAGWHEWTGLDFPGDGEYVVPGALAPVRFADGRGIYREPCVWLRHDVT